MITIGKNVVAALAMAVLTLGIGAFGCQKGPAERAGEKIDKAVEKGAQEIEKAGDKIKESVGGK